MRFQAGNTIGTRVFGQIITRRVNSRFIINLGSGSLGSVVKCRSRYLTTDPGFPDADRGFSSASGFEQQKC
jgi:hypothetical protein